jgi:hypothetical protein
MSTDAPRVEVYWNLHKKCFSYRLSGGKVTHARSLLLKDVKFAVQPAGRERVLREKKKNVHAFVRGTLLYVQNIKEMEDVVYAPGASEVIDNVLYNGYAARYNPYEAGHFQVSSIGTAYALVGADAAFLQDKNIFVLGVKLNDG